MIKGWIEHEKCRQMNIQWKQKNEEEKLHTMKIKKITFFQLVVRRIVESLDIVHN